MQMPAVAAFCLLLIGAANSQQPPTQAPQILTEQETNRSIETQQKAEQEKHAASPALAATPQRHSATTSNETERNGNNSGKQVSEFWTILGHPLKITDSLLVASTCLLF